MDYTPEQIAAFIGAAAWLPQIGSWAYKLYSKPTVIIIPDTSFELGYTNLGPIFNIRLAVSADIHDVLLDGFQVKIKHESGDAITLDWRATKETLNQTRNSTGILHTVEKEESGIAVKVRPDALVDKIFKFQDNALNTETKDMRDDLDRYIQYLRTKGEINRDELMHSDKVHLLVSTYKSKFTWRPGKYIATFNCKAINGSISQKSTQFRFDLSTQNIEHLRKNEPLFEAALEWSVFKGAQGALTSNPQYNWVYPKFTREI